MINVDENNNVKITDVDGNECEKEVVSHEQYKNLKNHTFAIRKLCPEECFALMGLKMEYVQKCRDVGVSDSQLYKIAGNGLICNHVQYMAESLYKTFVNPELETTDRRMVRLGYGVEF